MKSYTKLILLTLLIGTGCIKEYTTQTPLSSEMKEWMYFKKGSYWIYRDALSGKEDSIWVDTSYIKNECYTTKHGRAKMTECEDRMYVYQKSTFNTEKHIYESFRSAFVDLRFDYPFKGNYSGVFSLINSSNPYAADSVYTKYQLVGQNFINVLGYGLKTNNNKSHWLAKNIGVIRWRGNIDWFGFSSQTPCDLQLVRYKIVQ